jgi:uncharacterized protein (DUF1330 family)
MADKVGYWFVAQRRFAPGCPTDEQKAALMDSVAQIKALGYVDFMHMGPVTKVAELGATEGVPPMCAICKFPTVDKAVELFESDWYTKIKNAVGICTESPGMWRDFRILEANADLFKPGKAYWCAWIHQIKSQEKFDKYYAAFLEASDKGFRIKREDGTEVAAKLSIASAGGSFCYEEATKYVSEKGNGKQFGQVGTCDTGLVVVAEMEDHEIGKSIIECEDYKSCMLKAFDAEYTDEETYKTYLARMADEVIARDVRIICT